MNYGVPIPAQDGQAYQQPPPKVQAAMEFCRFAEQIRSTQGPFGEQSATRELNKTEADVYDSALMTMLEYFNTPGFGLGPVMVPQASADDGKQPEYVPQ